MSVLVKKPIAPHIAERRLMINDKIHIAAIGWKQGQAAISGRGEKLQGLYQALIDGFDAASL
jgi:hypothetical protein